MDALAKLLMLGAICALGVGLLLNARYVLALPGQMPRGARWAGLVWLIMAAGLAQWFGRTEKVAALTSVDSSAAAQIASIGLSSIVMLFLFQRTFSTHNLKYPFVLLLAYAVLGVVTAPLSLFPPLYIFKATSLIIAVSAAVMAVKSVGKVKDPTLLFNVIYVYFVLISFLAILGGVIYPEITHRPNKGVFGFMLVGWPALNSNSLSYVTAVVFVVSLHRTFSVHNLRLRLLYGGACAVGAIGLLLAQGRTSLISSALAILFLSFFSKNMRGIRYALLASLCILVGMFLMSGSVGDWINLVGEYLKRGVSDEQLSTLSGRTEAWKVSWDLFLAKPIFGYGFYASGKELLSPHNAAFTVLLNGGIIGFVPWLVAIVGGMWIVFRRLSYRSWRVATKENDPYLEMVAVMIVQFFRTITGQDLTIHSYSMLVFLGILVYMYSREHTEAIRRTPTGVQEQRDTGPADNYPKNARIIKSRRKISH